MNDFLKFVVLTFFLVGCDDLGNVSDVGDVVDDVYVQYPLFNFEEVDLEGGIVSQNSNVVVLEFFVTASSQNKEVYDLSFDLFVTGLPGRKFANLQVFVEEGRDFLPFFSSEYISSVNKTGVENIVSVAPSKSFHFLVKVDVVNDDNGGDEFWFCVYDIVSGEVLLCGPHFETSYH